MICYKDESLFSHETRSSTLDNDETESSQSIRDIENALEIFFTSSSPIESINQIEMILPSFQSKDINFTAYIFSIDFIPRILSLIDSLIFSEQIEDQDADSISIDFSNLSRALELINILISEKPELRNQDTLNFCFDLLNIYFERNMFPNFLNTIHLLMKCFLIQICKECIHKFNEKFFCKIKQFTIYNSEIHLDIAHIVEKMSLVLPQFDQKCQYFVDFIEELVEFSNEETSLPIITSFKNIIKKYPYFIHDDKSWTYKALINYTLAYDYNTQAVSFEVYSLLKHKNIITSLFVHPYVKNSIESIISQPNFDDIRLIPVIHALTHFLKLDPLNCTKEYISKERSEQLSPYLIQYIVNGSFDLKVDSGFLLSELIKYNALMFICGISNELSFRYQLNIGDLKDAIITILDFDDEGFNDLLISMLNGVHILCQTCIERCSMTDIETIQDEFGKSGLFDRIEYLKDNNESEDICLLCQSIFDCFEFVNEEEEQAEN